MKTAIQNRSKGELEIRLESVALRGDPHLPAGAAGLVIFAHRSGRKSSRNASSRAPLRERGIGTFLFDHLTLAEEREESRQVNPSALVCPAAMIDIAFRPS